MDSDLLLNDLIAVERKLERLTEEIRRMLKAIKRKWSGSCPIQPFYDALQQEIPLRDMEFSEEELKDVSGLAFLP
jgi:hypothetical protein